MSLHGQGLRAWLWQRLTSVYLTLFIIAALITYAVNAPLDYAGWRALLAQPAINVATAIFILALLFHAGVGMRDILVDYVHSLAWRFTILVGLLVILLALGIWSMWILISVVAL